MNLCEGVLVFQKTPNYLFYYDTNTNRSLSFSKILGYQNNYDGSGATKVPKIRKLYSHSKKYARHASQIQFMIGHQFDKDGRLWYFVASTNISP